MKTSTGSLEKFYFRSYVPVSSSTSSNKTELDKCSNDSLLKNLYTVYNTEIL